MVYWAMFILEKHGTQMIANQLALGKKFPYHQRWISNYGRDLHPEKITRIISFITIGIGSGIGVPVNRATMELMKLTVAVGFWALIIQRKLHLRVAGMHLKMIGRHQIHRLQVLNSVIKHR